MSEHRVIHSTFSIEHPYAALPERVFRAWADREAKAKWFGGPNSEYKLDFRVGGRETVRAANSEGAALLFESTYHEIIPDYRIVFSSTLSVEEKLATVSITTVEFLRVGEGTQLTLTEQGTFIEGLEQPSWREKGTSQQLDSLETLLKGADGDG